MGNDNKEINHHCVICGAGYHACDACSDVRTFNPWRKYTDTAEHFKVFMILNELKTNTIDMEQAKEMLSRLKLADLSNFKNKVVKEKIESILNFKKEDTVEKSTEHKSVRKRKTVSKPEKCE